MSRAISKNRSARRLAPPTNGAVNAGFAGKSGNVLGVDAASVEQRYLVGLIAIDAEKGIPYHAGHDLGYDFRGGGPPGTDGPHRLIRYYQVIYVNHVSQTRGQLPANHRARLSSLSLLQGLTHAQDGLQAVLNGGFDFTVDQAVVFAEKLPSFGMPQNHVFAQALEHWRSDFPGKRARVLIVHVLRPHFHRAPPQRIPDRGQRDEGRANNHLHAGKRPGLVPDAGGQLHRLG